MWGEEGLMLYNDAYAGVMGQRHPAGLGMSVLEIWPEAVEFNQHVLRSALSGETLSFKRQEFQLNRHREPEDAFFDLDYSPLVDQTGEPAGVLAIVIEVTEQVKAEGERDKAETDLIRREAHWRGLFEELSEGFVIGELIRDENGEVSDWRYVEANPAFGRLLGISHTAAVGLTIREVFPGIEDFWVDHMVETVEKDRPQTFIDRVGSLDRFYEGHTFPMGGDRFGVMFTDATERVTSDQHKTMLMAELDHRVKNILALVQSIARMTLRSDQNTNEAAVAALVGRIDALAHSHALLAESRWQGACFEELVKTAVTPYINDNAKRVRIEGQDFEVMPKAAQTLALLLHELATNAAKYGGLSREGGTANVSWTFVGEGEGTELIFEWQERGGPAIAQPPTRKGFGSLLIEKVMAYELGGQVKMDFAKEGLTTTVKLPLTAVRTKTEKQDFPARPSAETANGDASQLRGKRVLLAEDERLIAQQTAATLEKAGCVVVGPVGNLLDALKAAVTNDIDMAILDINLRGAFVWPVAHALRERGIPFLFATGYSSVVAMPEELSTAGRIEKPLNDERLLASLSRTISARN
jgi:two-component sensor histidine kinase/CheY-like chemotaxis protein